MHHELSLITTLAWGLGLALVLGVVAVRLRLPALVGYLTAGVVIGPFTPGVVADTAIANQLAEIGVMLLMFGVGLHFRLGDLLAVRRVALPGALVQMAVATLLGALLAHSLGFGWGGAVVFGLSLSVASTVVLLRALEARGAVDSLNGRIAIGWLVVEDLAMVLVLVLLPPLAPLLAGNGQAPTAALWTTLGTTLLQVAAFIALMLLVGRRLFPWLLWQVARTGSRELFTLCVIAAAIGIAYASSLLFGVSFALGAFFAGMVLRESALSHRAAADTLPLRDAFAVLFFVAVGMLFDPRVLLEHPLQVLAVVATIVIGKSVAAAVLVLLLRYPLNTALMVAASLAQIGEFSFILAGLGVALGLMPQAGYNLVLAGALISIALNPLVFAAIGPALAWVRRRSHIAARLELPDDPLATLPMSTDHRYLSGQVVLVGWGRIGRRVGAALRAQGLPFVVAEQKRDAVEQLRAAGNAAVSGDAADPGVLVQAHVARAGVLVIAIPDSVAARHMIETARMLNPGIRILARAESAEEAALLQKEGADTVFLGEELLAGALAGATLACAARAGDAH